jgi:hypothetical protein
MIIPSEGRTPSFFHPGWFFMAIIALKEINELLLKDIRSTMSTLEIFLDSDFLMTYRTCFQISKQTIPFAGDISEPGSTW